MFKLRNIVAAAIVLFAGSLALAQVNPGTFPPGYVMGNATSSQTNGSPSLITSVLNKACSLSPALCSRLFGNYNVQWFGAVGDRVTDDTTAIQSAVTFAQNVATGNNIVPCVYFPGSNSSYLISSTITLTKGVCLSSDGPGSGALYSVSNIPFVTVDTTGGDIYYLSVRNLGFISGNTGTKTSEAAIKTIGGNNMHRWTIIGNMARGVNRFLWTAGSGVGDWSQISQNTCTNEGAAVMSDCIYMPTGGFGSSIIANNNLYGTNNCILANGVGDLTISGNQANTCTNGISVTSNTSHFKAVANEWDAGVTNAYNLTSALLFYADDLIGGGVGVSITTPAGAIDIRRNRIDSYSLTASQNNFTFGGNLVRVRGFNVTPNGAYTITGFAGTGDAQQFFVYNAGASAITISCNDAGSTAGNRIACEGAGYSLRAGETIWFLYNMSALKWNVSAQPFNANLATVASFGTPTFTSEALTGITAHSMLVGENIGATVGILGTNGQIPVGQTGADPIFKTITGDVTLSAAGASTLATAQPAVHTWALAQTFTVAPVFTDQAGTRTALGLGTAATQNTGTSGANLPFLNGTNSWSGTNTFVNTTFNPSTGVGGVVINGPAAASLTLDVFPPAGQSGFLRLGPSAVRAEFQVDSSGNFIANLAGAGTAPFRVNAASSVTNTLLLDSGNVSSVGSIKSTNATGGIGYATGAGGAVTQITSRTTGVTLNTITGAITLVSAAGSATPASFTLTNSAIAATDIVKVVQKSGTDLYEIFVNAVAAGSCKITFFTTGGTTTEQPVFNFAVIKGVAS